MSTRLVILGLLKDKSLYGYELKHIIEEHMGDWTNIAFGSIYFALGKLRDEKLIEQVSEGSVGNRPARSVYRITETGRSYYLELLRELWQKQDREYYPLDIALAFSRDLPAEEVKGYLMQRIAAAEKTLEYLSEHRQEQLSRPEMPAMAKAVFSHAEYHMRAELSWLKEVRDEFDKGSLP